MEINIDDYDLIGIDLETTTDGYDDSPKACYNNNRILAIGNNKGSTSLSWIKEYLKLGGVGTHTPHIIVGHNLQFDIGYLIREWPELPWTSWVLWDTAIADYLFSGHVNTFPSLEDTASRNGIAYKKCFDVKAWLASGKRMEDADPTLLQTYANEDAEVAVQIMREQWKFSNPKLRKLILDQSANALAIASIELNGMQFSASQASSKLLMNESTMGAIVHDLRTQLGLRYPYFKDEDIKRLNITANRTLSAILYGYPKEIEVGKKKKEKKVLVFDQPIVSIPTRTPPNKTLGYPVSEEVLRSHHNLFSRHILQYRGLYKETNTYLAPLITRATVYDDYVYTNIHTASTNTGRTSSSNPNFQNMPVDIRKLFYADDGDLYEIDFKQLELCSIAELSGDAQLIKDIQDGVDVHYEVGRQVFGWKVFSDMASNTRRRVKSIVFCLCYGGGATTLSIQADVEKSIAQAVIEAFYARYPGVHHWHTETLKEAESNKWQSTELHPITTTLINNTKLIIDHTGRYFIFKDQDSPDWMKRKGVHYSFSPTKLKNYRAQGFAGGDVVLNYLKVLYHLIGGEQSKIRLRNMIHDSIVLSVPPEQVELFSNAVVQAKTYIEKSLNLKVPLTIETKSSGKYWK